MVKKAEWRTFEYLVVIYKFEVSDYPGSFSDEALEFNSLINLSKWQDALAKSS